MKNLIVDEVTKEFAKLISDYFNKYTKSEGNSRDNNYEKAGKITKVIEKLKNSDYIEKVINAASRKFYNPKFLKSIDEKKIFLEQKMVY